MMNKFVRFIFFSAIAIGFILLIFDRSHFPDFYNPPYMAGSAFASALVIISPRLFFKKKNKDAVIKFQAAIAAAILINGLGALGFYRLFLIGFPYDKFAHFMIPLILVLGITNFGINYFKKDFRYSLLWAIGIVLLGGFVWEFFEFFSDVYFGTQTLGDYGENIGRDTVLDIVFNILGILTGWIIIRKKELDLRKNYG